MAMTFCAVLGKIEFMAITLSLHCTVYLEWWQYVCGSRELTIIVMMWRRVVSVVVKLPPQHIITRLDAMRRDAMVTSNNRRKRPTHWNFCVHWW